MFGFRHCQTIATSTDRIGRSIATVLTISIALLVVFTALATALLTPGDLLGQEKASKENASIKAFSSQRILDATRLSNGKPLLLYRQKATNEDETPAYERGSIKRFERLFDHPTDPDGQLGISWLDADKKNGMGIYSFRDGVTKFETHISERIRQPSFFQSEAGDIFIGSRNGVIYWIKPDKSRLRFQLPLPEGQEPEPNKVFREIQFTSFPGSNVVCAYSIADPRYHPRALYEIAVADPEKGWRTVDLGRQATGPAVMTSPTELKMLRYDRWLNIDLAKSEFTETKFEIPNEGDSKVKPMLVTRTIDGTLLSIWRRHYRSYKPDDLDPFENGFYQRICQWNDDENKWDVVQGKNRGISKELPQAIDKDGGWWLGTSEGTLLHRDNEGEFRELGYQYGIATDSIGRVKIDRQNRLWLFGNVPIEIDMAALRAAEPVSSPEWRELYSKIPIGISRLAPFRTVSPAVTPENKVICFDDVDRSYDLPSADVFPITGRQLITFEDNQGRPWLVSTGDEEKFLLAGFIDGAWKIIDVDKVEGQGWLESIAQWLSQNNHVHPIDYLGTKVGFGPEGRIAVMLKSELKLFDGKNWSSTPIPSTAGRYRQRGQTIEFRIDRMRIWVSRYLAFDLANHHWKDVSSNIKELWETVNEPVGLSSNYRERREASNQRLANTPLKDSGAWLYSDEFRYAQFLPDKVSLYDGHHWTTVPTSGSPLAARRSISSMARHRNGHWIFRMSTASGNSRYIVYRPKVTEVSVAEKSLGDQANSEAELNPTWVSPTPLADLKLRYQVDNGSWSDWQPSSNPILPGAVVPQGEHQLRVELHCPDQMLSTEPLEYNFNVTYDLTSELESLLNKLSSMDFEEREQAEKSLAEKGEHIIELLSSRYENEKDPNTRAAIGRILSVLKGKTDKN